jgi:hypothetical protein
MGRRPLVRSWCYIQSVIPRLRQHRCSNLKTPILSYNHCPVAMDSHETGKRCPSKCDSAYHSSPADWNSNDEFFKFTRGRFIVDEAENLRRREIRFDLNRLAKVAADSVGAAQCISIKKYPDGMFNKAFLMSMENGREVVAKVPNPNAGLPHFTTASEVATMEFVSRPCSPINIKPC